MRAGPDTAGLRAPLVRAALLVTLGLLAVRILVAGEVELSFDEAYYWLWSRALSPGYLDHAPGVAAWIRASTALFGEDERGVRMLGVLGAALGSLAVFHTARLLYDDARLAAFAVLLLNATLLIGVGSLVVTPDTPLVASWLVATLALAELLRSGDLRWWWLVGLAAGLALLSKYTAFFLGGGIVLAMIVVRPLRRHWTHPAPYAAGLLALLLFTPVLWWNLQHDWASFAKQFGRTAQSAWQPLFLLEFLAAQAGLLTPFVFVLAVVGLALAFRPAHDGADDGRRLLAATILPALAYFLWHAARSRVEGNWPAPLYPALAILGADAARRAAHSTTRLRGALAPSRRLAVPVGLAVLGVVYLQAALAPLPLPARMDPTARLAGWRELGREVEAVRAREGAAYILTSSYGLTGLLTYYRAGEAPVFQFNQRLRWTFLGEPAPGTFSGVGLYVVEPQRDYVSGLQPRFAEVSEVARLERRRRGEPAGSYIVYRLAGPRLPVLDPVE